MWQELHTELEPFGLTIVMVALDEVDASREWIKAANPTYPCLIDPDHVVAQRYGFINVPSCVWIDEDDRIVRPADITPANDLFKDFTGIDSNIHHDQLRAWAHDGTLPVSLDEVSNKQHVPSEDDVLAQLHRRIAAHMHRKGNDAAAANHFETARTLAPWDWAINRGSMPLTGRDPFGQEFFDYVQAWGDAGAPGYGWGNSAMRSESAQADQSD